MTKDENEAFLHLWVIVLILFKNFFLPIVGYVEVRNLSSLFVQLKTKFGLRIQFAKDGERIYIQLSSRWKGRTLGLCGTYNGNLRDDFL